MKQIDRLVLGADYYGTLLDVIGTFGGELAALSPAAKEKIRRMILEKFKNGVPPKDAHPQMKAAYEALK